MEVGCALLLLPPSPLPFHNAKLHQFLQELLVGDTEGHQTGNDMQAGHLAEMMVHGQRPRQLPFRLRIVKLLMAARLASIAHQSFLLQVFQVIPQGDRLGRINYTGMATLRVKKAGFSAWACSRFAMLN